MTSLAPRTRLLVDDFTRLFIPGSTMKRVFAELRRLYNMSNAEIKASLESELEIDMGSTKSLMKKVYKDVDLKPADYYVIIPEREKN